MHLEDDGAEVIKKVQRRYPEIQVIDAETN